MESLTEVLRGAVTAGSWTQAVLSQPRKGSGAAADKVKIKPVLLKSGLHYQFAHYAGTKVQHENIAPEQAAARTEQLLLEQYRQALLQTSEADYHILFNKKGEAAVLKKKATKPSVELSHNRKKRYVLEEGTPVPFLVELGVMNGQGKVLAAKYDKFRQINRFLEMIDDVAPHLPQTRTVRIVDFGCGKSYLTFALYHYLNEIRKLDLQVVGLDLKEDVIRHCNDLAARLGYDRLRFLVGDISRYDEQDEVDMVVTLHACDTATDAAIEKAVRWGAGVILSVPCCQHELFGQIRNEAMSPLLKHGILKERFASLITDAARAQLLELLGYKTQVLEFIDMEHTPKNLLIRAVKEHNKGHIDNAKERAGATGSPASAEAAAYRGFAEMLGITPYLERALADKLAPSFTPPKRDAGL
ncbi:SAM-dependent methyltransferase [Paenibacillus hemerocallicola]|uniref:SAM-dependent methyltransferase n=1 Tax=Paenibacillus hemerocallicola TaxID=1172614 RepID=A0A5C4TD56_9BACL|nr:SAM-dependent methyltransferase [Paenibacillus hemerocallicola]TNJ66802.1 SAM-dependent methyltransferase [Paenibacillus hemerocallicola]